MYELLKGLRIIECSSFVASPSAGLYLSQLGAEVIRVDHVAGGPDYKRWPVSENGDSFYWEGLNKGKASVAINVRTPEGRELVQRLATAPGASAGIILTNYPVDGFLSHAALQRLRQDQITVRVMGTARGGPALDYTVNSAVGYPLMTGSAELGDEPVNHVLPAWDLLVGAYAAFALMAALHHRNATGLGQEVRIPLTDMAISTLANLGQIAEVLSSNKDRPRIGNDLYGAFGRDFLTRDGKRLIIVAITQGQWTALVSVLGIGDEVAAIEARESIDLTASESVRFAWRHLLNPLVARAVANSDFPDLTTALDAKGGCWGPYQSVLEAARDPELVTDNPIFQILENASGVSYPVNGAPATLPGLHRLPPKPAPALGCNSEKIVRSLLQMGAAEFDELRDRGIVGT